MASTPDPLRDLLNSVSKSVGAAVANGALNQGVDKLKSAVSDALNKTGSGPAATAEKPFEPTVEITETPYALVVTVELPGMSRDDVQLALSGGTLTVRGEKRRDPARQADQPHRSERRYGPFSRTFALPTEVDQTAIRAAFRDGVLTVTLPKRGVAQPPGEVAIPIGE